MAAELTRYCWADRLHPSWKTMTEQTLWSSTNYVGVMSDPAMSLLIGCQMGSVIMTNAMNSIMHQVGCDLDQQNKVMLFLMHLPQTKRDSPKDTQGARAKMCLTSLATFPVCIWWASMLMNVLDFDQKIGNKVVWTRDHMLGTSRRSIIKLKTCIDIPNH